MMTTDVINQVLKAFGASISLPEIELNSENTCTLRLDGDQNIQFIFNPQRESLDFFTKVGTLPEEGRDHFCNCLLLANAEWELTQGTSLSKKEDEDAVILQYPLPILNLTLEVFNKVFAHFVQQLDTWKEYLKEMQQGLMPEALAELK